RLDAAATPTDDLIIDCEHAPCMPQHLGSAFGENHPGETFCNQVRADHGFQPSHMRTHGRLGQIQKIGGLGEASQFANRNECAHQIGRDIGPAGRDELGPARIAVVLLLHERPTPLEPRAAAMRAPRMASRSLLYHRSRDSVQDPPTSGADAGGTYLRGTPLRGTPRLSRPTGHRSGCYSSFTSLALAIQRGQSVATAAAAAAACPRLRRWARFC